MQLESSLRLTKYDLRCTHEAMDYIDKNFSDYISAIALSVEVSLSVKKLQAGIQRETGLGLHDYILKVRVEKAKPFSPTPISPSSKLPTPWGLKRPVILGKYFESTPI